MRWFPAWFVLLLACSAAASACSAPGANSVDTSEPVDVDAGRQLFQTSCRACHSLADANAAGVFGPDLDILQPDAETVLGQIDEGGGGMPADILTGADAQLVARYVAQVAGRGAALEDPAGRRGATRAPTDAGASG